MTRLLAYAKIRLRKISKEIKVKDELRIPEKSDLDIIKDLIRDRDLEIESYGSLILMIRESEDFMQQLRKKLRESFTDNPTTIYYDYEFLLRCRDYLATQSAKATALYRSCKKGFKPKSGTIVDKELEVDHAAAPYKFYSLALDERIKSLDNRCTAAKQQQRVMEEAIKRNLID